MIVQNLDAPLTESEERPIDRAIMSEADAWRDCTMSYKELAELRAKENESLRRKCDCIECENIKLRRELEKARESIERYYKGFRNED